MGLSATRYTQPGLIVTSMNLKASGGESGGPARAGRAGPKPNEEVHGR